MTKLDTAGASLAGCRRKARQVFHQQDLFDGLPAVLRAGNKNVMAKHDSFLVWRFPQPYGRSQTMRIAVADNLIQRIAKRG